MCVCGTCAGGCARPSIQIVRYCMYVPLNMPVRDDLLRRRILVFPDPELDRAAVDVRDVVRLALVLEHRDARDVERLGILARGVVHRHAREVALHVAGHAIALVLVIAARPFADERRAARARASTQPRRRTAKR